MKNVFLSAAVALALIAGCRSPASPPKNPPAPQAKSARQLVSPELVEKISLLATGRTDTVGNSATIAAELSTGKGSFDGFLDRLLASEDFASNLGEVLLKPGPWLH